MTDTFNGVFDWTDADYDDLGQYFNSLGTFAGSPLPKEEPKSNSPSFGGFIDGAKATGANLNMETMSQAAAASIASQGNISITGGNPAGRSSKPNTVTPQQFYAQWSFRLARFAGVAKDTGVSK